MSETHTALIYAAPETKAFLEALGVDTTNIINVYVASSRTAEGYGLVIRGSRLTKDYRPSSVGAMGMLALSPETEQFTLQVDITLDGLEAVLKHLGFAGRGVTMFSAAVAANEVMKCIFYTEAWTPTEDAASRLKTIANSITLKE